MGRSIPRLFLAALALSAACGPASTGGGDELPFRARVVEEVRTDRTVSAVTFDREGGRKATVVASTNGRTDPPAGVAAYPGPDFWTRECRRFVEGGFATIAGRTARRYTCRSPRRMDVWLDTDTDLVLRRELGRSVVSVDVIEYGRPPSTASGGPPLAPGTKVDPVALSLLGGGTVTVPPGDGRPEIVVVFTTWCGTPCFDALDDLAEAAPAFGDRAHVLALATGGDDRAADVEAALADRPTTLPVAVDAAGRVGWRLPPLPAWVVIDGSGAVAAVRSGPWSAVESDLLAAVG